MLICQNCGQGFEDNYLSLGFIHLIFGIAVSSLVWMFINELSTNPASGESSGYIMGIILNSAMAIYAFFCAGIVLFDKPKFCCHACYVVDLEVKEAKLQVERVKAKKAFVVELALARLKRKKQEKKVNKL